jgi:hypothetical protein
MALRRQVRLYNKTTQRRRADTASLVCAFGALRQKNLMHHHFGCLTTHSVQLMGVGPEND